MYCVRLSLTFETESKAMTQDFGQPYRQVGYYGIWADETGDDYELAHGRSAIRGGGL
jgi:hypothetical protein